MSIPGNELTQDEFYQAAENAARKKDPNKVKTILEAFKLKDKSTIEALFLESVKNKDEIMLTFILEEGTRTAENELLLNIDNVNNPLHASLFYWSLRQHFFKIAEILYQYGANPYVGAKGILTPPLMTAIRSDHKVFIDFLMNTLKLDPTEPDARDPKRTIESIAIERQNLEVLKIVEEYKAKKKEAALKLEQKKLAEKKEGVEPTKDKTEMALKFEKTKKEEKKLTITDALNHFSESLKKKMDPIIALKILNETWEKEKFDLKPLFGAIVFDNLEVLEKLASLKVDLHQPLLEHENHLTPLIWASICNNNDIINFFLDNKADPNLKLINGKSALYFSISKNNSSAVEKLLKHGADPNQKQDNVPILLKAALEGSVEIVNLLIQAGADIQAQDSNGFTALMRAARWGHAEIVELLIKKGALVNHTSTKEHDDIAAGSSALMRAATFGHESAINVLARHGARLDAVDANGKTALIHALENNKLIAAATLISLGANISKESQQLIDQNAKWSKEVLEKIKSARKIHTGPSLEEFSKVFSLHKSKQDSKKDEKATKENEKFSQNSMIKRLIETNDFEKIKMLPQYGINLNTYEMEGIPILFWAIINKHYEAITSLCEAGANVNQKNKNGDSPLSFSIDNKLPSAINACLYSGADLSLEDKNGDIPLFCALKNDDRSTAIRLLMPSSSILAKQQSAGLIKQDLSQFFNKYPRPYISYSPPQNYTTNVNQAEAFILQETQAGEALLAPFLNFMMTGSTTLREISFELLMNQWRTNATVNRMTPLTWALQYSTQEVVKALLNSMGDAFKKQVNETDLEGNTALCLAAKQGLLPTAELLIKSGADVNLANRPGDSPLMRSAMNGQVSTSQYLIQSGANLYYQNKNTRHNVLSAGILSKNPALIKTLYDQGLDINNTNIVGLLPSQWATDKGKETLEALIAAGANPNQRNQEDISLYEAAKILKFQKNALENLEKMGADPEFNNNKIIIRRLGHLMGLSGRIQVETSRCFNLNGVLIRELETADVKTEGGGASLGVRLLREELSEYLKTKEKQGQDSHWKRILEPFNLLYKETIDTAPFFNKTLAKELDRRYNNKVRFKAKALTTTPTGWLEHGLSVALYKDYLIITNRGIKGDESYGSKIYKIAPEKLSSINEHFFKLLIDNNLNSSADELFKIISTVVDLNQEPFAKFPSKSQKHSTCNFINQKSSVEPMLFLLKLEEGVSHEVAADYARREYKLFTNFIREHEINKLIQLINSNQKQEALNKKEESLHTTGDALHNKGDVLHKKEGSSHKKDSKEGQDLKPVQGSEKERTSNKMLYVQLVKAIITEHHEEPEENLDLTNSLKIKNREMERAIKLIDGLPQEYLELLKKDADMRIPLEKIAGYKAKKLDIAKKEQQKALGAPKTKETSAKEASAQTQTLDLTKHQAGQTKTEPAVKDKESQAPKKT